MKNTLMNKYRIWVKKEGYPMASALSVLNVFIIANDLGKKEYEQLFSELNFKK